MKHNLIRLLVLSSFVLSLISAAPPPPSPSSQPEQTSQVEQAIREAITARKESSMALLVYDTQIDRIQFSTDGSWATALLNPVDPETGQVVPAEPGLAIVQQQNNDWQVTLPSDPEWSSLLEKLPAGALADGEKTSWVEMYSQAKTEALTAGPFSGYMLPWAKGETMYMTQSVHHDAYDASYKAHYAFDFASPGWPSGMFPVYAAKGGTVWRVVWTHEDGNTQYANYLILQDTTTSPTSYQLYMHFSKDSIPPELRVVGAAVKQGQFIGIADDTGISSGNHLHFHVHLNPDLYWDQSVDITFDDVAINGGRPRISSDLPYCLNNDRFHDVCLQTQSTYVSGNVVTGDRTPPDGGIQVPAKNGITVSNPILHLEGWASDQESDIYQAQFIANYGSGWQNLGDPFTSGTFSMDWDLCSSGVPDGPVSVALFLQDTSGNQNVSLPGLRHFIKNYACPAPPPQCTPADNQIGLFAEPNYQGACTVLGTGSYTSSSALGAVGDNNAESIQVGTNVQASLFMNSDLHGRGETFRSNDRNLSENIIGANTTTSVLVQARTASPLVPVLTWPASGATYPEDTSLSLAWDNGGSNTLYQAQLLKDGQVFLQTPAWHAEPFWHIGSLAAGSYSWKVQAKNDNGLSAWSTARSLVIETTASTPPEPPTYSVPFTDDMETNPDKWTHSNYWDLTDTEKHSQVLSWMYDTNSASGYDTGEPNSGDLTSPPIEIMKSGAFLRFWYYYETEGPGTHWDQRWVQISTDGEPFKNILQLSDDPPKTWLQSPAIDLSGYAGSTIRVRFHFETLDSAFNNYMGWFIDDFSIDETAPPTCSDTNNTATQATLIAYGSATTEKICPAGDIDFYKFNGKAGDQVGIAVVSQNPGAIDPYTFLLDSDGTTLLAENDDQILHVNTDSFLSYKLPHDGTYFIKVRAWGHPSAGGEEAIYTLKLNSEAGKPTVSISSPAGGTYLPNTPFTITVAASDSGSGISHVDCLWHSGDWKYGDWVVVDTDWDGSDGWKFNFDPSNLPDQSGIAFFVRAYDGAGNWAGSGSWDLARDHTPPVTTLQTLPGTLGSNAIQLTWSASDNLAGIKSFDLQQMVDNNGTWQDLQTNIPGDSRQSWVIAAAGHTYGFRLRGVDLIGNTEAYPTLAEASTTVPKDLCSAGDQWENDNLYTHANLLNLNTPSQLHNFCNPESGTDWQGDTDWVKLSLSAGESMFLEGAPQAPSAAVVLELYDSGGISGTLLVKNSPAAFGDSSRLFWYSENGGTYYLRMTHLDPRVTGESASYLIRLRQGYLIYLPDIHNGK
jgi:murein DD-endopeptidase MepM/ murein hydrolase activator NlpD